MTDKHCFNLNICALLFVRSEPWDYMSRSDPGKQHSWEPVGHSAMTDWKKYSGKLKVCFNYSVGWKNNTRVNKCFALGAASTSDDELPPSEEDEDCPANRDLPHLRFEITSDDGFSVEADNIEGKAKTVSVKAPDELTN